MAPAQQSGSDSNQIVVHHLSDVRHTESGNEGTRNNFLTRYQVYLHDDRLPREQYPDFVVVTGDLTRNGTRAELRSLAEALSLCFAEWENNLHKHIVVVPGPHDVNWESDKGVGLAAFYDIFKDFATPAQAPVSGWRDSPEGKPEEICIAYPLDTCYAPDDLTPDLKGKFDSYVTDYGVFLDQRAKLGKRRSGLWSWLRGSRRREEDQKEALKQLHEQYLKLTEGARQFDPYTGRITAQDAANFERWADQFRSSGGSASSAAPGSAAEEIPPLTIPPLKMLVTHHPIDIRPEEDTAEAERKSAQSSFQQVASAARNGGVNLALHGHVHKPEIFSEQAIFEGPDGQRPLRQLGAASLGDTGCFNEITATYRGKPGKAAWSLDVRLVDLKTLNPAATSSVVLANPAGIEERKSKQLQRSVTLRSDFERNTSIAMRRFSEDVNLVRPGYRPNPTTTMPALPQAALLVLKEAVEAIFKDCDTRVRLLLKSTESSNSPVPQLVPKYLEPVIMDGPETLTYPASVAAWALVLGRTLKFPDIQEQVTQPEDHAWLRSARKIPALLKALTALEASAKTTNDGKSEKRYHTLISNLEAIQSPPSGQDTVQISGETIFQASPGANPPRSYLGFICVPYPMRTPGGALPTLPEIAVLDIGVRPKQDHDKEDSATIPTMPFNPFTDERVEMLEALSELIGLILVASDALGKPPGVWHDPR